MDAKSLSGCPEGQRKSFLDGGLSDCRPIDENTASAKKPQRDAGPSEVQAKAFVAQLPKAGRSPSLTNVLGLKSSDLQILANDRPLALGDFQPNSPLLKIFLPEDLPDIFNFLWRSPYPKPGTPLRELHIALRILNAILAKWEELKQKKIFFQKLESSDDCSMAHALLVYQPFPPSKVSSVSNNQRLLSKWASRIDKQEPVSGRLGIYEASIISNPLPYSLTYTILTKSEQLGNVFGGSFDLLPYETGFAAVLPGARFNELHGKFYFLPTREGKTLLVRRSYADVSLVPDQLFCDVGKAGLIQSMSALACRVSDPQWTIRRGDRSALNYSETVECKHLEGFGELKYTFGGDLEW